MSLTVKAYLSPVWAAAGPGGPPVGAEAGPGGVEREIRRFSVDEDVATNYEYLRARIGLAFPALRGRAFLLSWRDSEDDVVQLSSDEELLVALSHIDDGLFRVHVHLPAAQACRGTGPHAQHAFDDVMTPRAPLLNLFAGAQAGACGLPPLWGLGGFAGPPPRCPAGAGERSDASGGQAIPQAWRHWLELLLGGSADRGNGEHSEASKDGKKKENKETVNNDAEQKEKKNETSEASDGGDKKSEEHVEDGSSGGQWEEGKAGEAKMTEFVRNLGALASTFLGPFLSGQHVGGGGCYEGPGAHEGLWGPCGGHAGYQGGACGYEGGASGAQGGAYASQGGACGCKQNKPEAAGSQGSGPSCSGNQCSGMPGGDQGSRGQESRGQREGGVGSSEVLGGSEGEYEAREGSQHAQHGTAEEPVDALISEALATLQRLGFTDEDGWLEALLAAHRGDIGGALAAWGALPTAGRSQAASV